MRSSGISDPANVQRVAYYDTCPENVNYSDYQGAWGVYPYLPSGNIIASDVLHGLFVLRPDYSALLPVAWGAFTAKAQEDGIQLRWQTETELGTDYFELERSSDGRLFGPIARVPAAGQSRAPLHYAHLDAQPGAGTHYYRVRQADLDGTSTYFKVVAADWLPPLAAPRFYPNLALPGQAIGVSLSTPVPTPSALSLHNALGQLCHTWPVPAHARSFTIHLPAALPSGVYRVAWRGAAGHALSAAVPLVLR